MILCVKNLELKSKRAKTEHSEYQRLSVAATAAGVSANEFVVQSIEYALENLALDEDNKE